MKICNEVYLTILMKPSLLTNRCHNILHQILNQFNDET
jgi:hypothetical protein